MYHQLRVHIAGASFYCDCGGFLIFWDHFCIDYLMKLKTFLEDKGLFKACLPAEVTANQSYTIWAKGYS